MSRFSRLRNEHVALLLGLLIGVAWFLFNITLPPNERGMHCCDSAEYISRAMQQDVWHSTGHRTFGYPWYLSLFVRLHHYFSPTDTFGWVPAAMTLQVAIWFVCCFIMFRALRRFNAGFSYYALALLFAHPAFSSYAATTLTDSLSSSLFCLVIAALVILQVDPLRPLYPSLWAGLSLGLITTMRPSFQVISFITLAVITLYLIARTWSERLPMRARFTVPVVAVSAFLLGFAPPYYKTAKNCIDQYGEFCLLDQKTITRAQKDSLFQALTAVRWWSSNTTGYRNTSDSYVWLFAHSCEVTQGIPEEKPFTWLLNCYLKRPSHTALYLLKKITSGFDNYFLNAYATDETTPAQRVFNRTFSVFGFLGFFLAVGALVFAPFRGSLRNCLYLVVPVLFVMTQINFHIESRYFFPTYPVFFLFFFYAAHTALQASALRQLVFWAMTASLSALFLFQTLYWDLKDCWYNHHQVNAQTPRRGLMLSCPSDAEVDRRLERYYGWLPL